MADTAAARRYARALFDLAIQQGNLKTIETDLNDLATLLRDNPQLREFFIDPVTTEDRQQATITALLHGKVDVLTERFLLFLVEKSRLEQLNAICQLFQQLCDEANGLVHAHIVTARELDEDQMQALKTRLEQITQKTVVPHVQVQPSLLGGFKVKIGDKVMDMTLQNQLRHLRENIINA